MDNTRMILSVSQIPQIFSHVQAVNTAAEVPPIAEIKLPSFPKPKIDMLIHIYGKTVKLSRLIAEYTFKNPGAKVCFLGSGLKFPLGWVKEVAPLINLNEEEIYNLSAGAKKPRDLDFVFIRGQRTDISLVSVLCELLSISREKLVESTKFVENSDFTLVNTQNLDLVEASSLPHLTTSEGIHYRLNGNKGLFAASGTLAEALIHRAKRIIHYPHEQWKHLAGSFKRIVQMQTQGWRCDQEWLMKKCRTDSLHTLCTDKVAPDLAKRLSHLPQIPGMSLAYVCNALFRLREGEINNVDQIAGKLFHYIGDEGTTFEALARDLRCNSLVQTFVYVARLLHVDPSPHAVITTYDLKLLPQLLDSEIACRALLELENIKPHDEVIDAFATHLDNKTAARLFINLVDDQHPQYFDAVATLAPQEPEFITVYSSKSVLSQHRALCTQAVRYFLSKKDPAKALRRLLLLKVKNKKLASGVVRATPDEQRTEAFYTLQEKGYFKNKTHLDFIPSDPELERLNEVPLKTLKKAEYKTPKSLIELKRLCNSHEKHLFYLEKLLEFCDFATQEQLKRFLRAITLEPEAKELLVLLKYPVDETLKYIERFSDWQLYLRVYESAGYTLSEQMIDEVQNPPEHFYLQPCFEHLNDRFPALALSFAKRFYKRLDLRGLSTVDDEILELKGLQKELLLKRLSTCTATEALHYIRRKNINFKECPHIAQNLLEKARAHPNIQERTELFHILTKSFPISEQLDFKMLNESGLLLEASQVLGDLFGNEILTIKRWTQILVIALDDPKKHSTLIQRVGSLFSAKVKGKKKEPLSKRILEMRCFKKEAEDTNWPFKLLLYKKVISVLWGTGRKDAAKLLWEVLEKPLMECFKEPEKIEFPFPERGIQKFEILLPLFMTTLTTIYFMIYGFPTK